MTPLPIRDYDFAHARYRRGLCVLTWRAMTLGEHCAAAAALREATGAEPVLVPGAWVVWEETL